MNFALSHKYNFLEHRSYLFFTSLHHHNLALLSFCKGRCQCTARRSSTDNDVLGRSGMKKYFLSWILCHNLSSSFSRGDNKKVLEPCKIERKNGEVECLGLEN